MLKQAKIKVATKAKQLLAGSGVRRLVRHEDGSAAVEFGLVAAPFLALLFAIIETSLIFFAGQTLETATADASRLILTGQAQSQGFTQAQFKQAICARIYAMFDCNNGLLLDVRTSSSFSSATTSKPIDQNGNLVNNFTFNPGGPGCIVVARAMYQWPVYVSLLGLNLSRSDMAGGKRRLMATAALRNEPYGAATSC